MRRILVVLLFLVVAACAPAPTATVAPPTDTPVAPTVAPTETPTVEPTQGAPIEPFPDAPLCPNAIADHDYGMFHTLWDSAQGCRHDHEHGTFPFTDEVAAAFPGFDLRALIGGVGVGHTNPSSPLENTDKHGGLKWDINLASATGCNGREGVPTGVDAAVIQYHGFGDYSIEFEARLHSAVGLLRQCRTGDPTDYGYVFVNQLQDYGQRTSPYQGTILPYPDTPLPVFEAAREPYFTVECFGPEPKCNRYPTYSSFVAAQPRANTTWISEPVNIESGSELFALLFRARDIYQVLDSGDLVYPFTFLWLCSEDGGLTFAPVTGCKYNNSTTTVHEIVGEIPAAWDNLEGFDTDPRVGRITAEGFVTRFGDLNQSCTAPGPDCHPIKLVSAFTGRYGKAFGTSILGNAFDPPNTPERDIYFCGGQVCGELDAGAVSSGWIGPRN